MENLIPPPPRRSGLAREQWCCRTRPVRGQARSYGSMVLLCLVLLTACSDSGRDTQPSQTLVLDSRCNVRSGCTARGDGVSVSVHMASTRSALKPFNVTLSSDAALNAVTVSLEMQGMDMGQNHYRLLRAADGSWQAEITLPVCASGRSDWLADFELQTAKARYRFGVPFTLGK